MSVDVSKETGQIRQAIKGRDVRESLAGGIEKIAGDVNQFETNSTQKQNDYEGKINDQWSDYKQAMDADETIRKNNENIRISNEATRQSNEGLRQDMYTDFRDYTNELATAGKISYEIDGGWIGDEDDGTGLNIDGGTL